MSEFDPQRLARLAHAMQHHVEQDRVGGVAWLLAAGDQVEVGVAGQLTRGEPTPVGRDSIFRISSMTKPIVAVAALILGEEYTLRLDDPVDGLLPELSDRRVLVDARASVDAMTTDQIDAASGAPGPLPDGSQGWGFGVGVHVRRTGLGPSIGSYGWAGGMGSMWSNDPSNALVGVMLSTNASAGPFPPPAVIQDFWTGAYTGLDN